MLERLGWRFHRIRSSEWFRNRGGAVEKVIAAYEDALVRADEDDGMIPRSSTAARDGSRNGSGDPEAGKVHVATRRLAPARSQSSRATRSTATPWASSSRAFVRAL
jgi:hypothetical protein